MEAHPIKPGGVANRTPESLDLFQVLAGLSYAFPRAMARLRPQIPRLLALGDAVAAEARVAAYLDSPRRVPFNEKGIFRHYPELDA